MNGCGAWIDSLAMAAVFITGTICFTVWMLRK